MEHLFFKDWPAVFHIIICAVISYIVLFIFIRISGKRTLAKLNAFDFVVTVTLGSTLSSMILKKVPLVEGFVALITIIALQYLLAFLAKNSSKMEDVINSTPTLLFYDGKFILPAMKKEVITEEEIYSEIRKYRLESLEDVQAVVMELNGTFTVVKKSNKVGPSSLDDIELEH
ncbi:hypothetical protein ASE92_09880 [Pedobacter sp. Leaf41]|jgi:uncharacterized membrane protein YcaP (DUF421 family)|uniref:DUF421 domain-containing protein n=1 Tax=Pedobacter sp. Leaf41 TaxID=1736218 RepID=UPI000702E0D9|nr:YetF domain-containing protein [Pedobacter sp. Leaf41]KQN34937.1 hypothetical protein ASE92_09880 [Pedobacter sp. Leaf41]